MSTEAEHPHADAEVDGTEADKINTGALGTLVAVGLFAMLSITAAVTALVRHDLQEEEALKDGDANAVVVGLKKAQRATLEAPASYLDKGKGTVALPIDYAKNLVVKELEHDPSSATPPAPAGSAAGATNAGVAPAADGGKVDDKKAPEATDGNKALETGRDVKAPHSVPKTPVPTPTPTAATPGAEAPGPTNK